MSSAVRAAVFAVRGYQCLVSPLLPPSCRFVPTCSEYAAQVITEHGVIRGAGLAMRRLLKCHPFHSGGFDPPPMSRRRE